MKNWINDFWIILQNETQRKWMEMALLLLVGAVLFFVGKNIRKHKNMFTFFFHSVLGILFYAGVCVLSQKIPFGIVFSDASACYLFPLLLGIPGSILICGIQILILWI